MKLKPLFHRFAAWTASAVFVVALGAGSLFAAGTSAGVHGRSHRGAFLSTYLNLTPTQQTQAKSIFQSARQSAQSIREQLKQTRQLLHAAIQANNTAEIQQLATSEGSEIGQLAAIRGTAMAKVYQMLTPDQQQRLMSLQQARKAARQAHAPVPSGGQN